MSLKNAIVVSAALAAAAVSADPTWGPRENREDQLRGWWHGGECFFPAYRALGLNFVSIPQFSEEFRWRGDDPAAYRNAKEIAARRRRIEAFRAEGLEWLDFLLVSHRGLYIEATRPDGTKAKRSVGYNDPEYRRRVERAIDIELTRTGIEDPTVCGVHVGSEFGDGAAPSWVPEFTNAWSRHSGGRPLPAEAIKGRPPHWSRVKGFPVSRIIPDDDPLLDYCRWLYLEGNGRLAYIDDAARWSRETAAKCGRTEPFMTFYDPVARFPPIVGLAKGVSHVNHWSYMTPTPMKLDYIIAEEQAVVRGNGTGQQILAMLQMMGYRTALAPKGKAPVGPAPKWYAETPPEIRDRWSYISMPAAFVREGLWSIFARRMDGLMFYNMFAFADLPKYGATPRAGDGWTDPTLQPVAEEVMQRVAVPLGPLLRAVPERLAEVALVESDSSYFYANRGTLGWGEMNGAALTAASLAPMAIFEEEIAAHGVPAHVKALVMPNCDVLRASAAAQIRAWQARGGLLVGDANLAPGLSPDAWMPSCALKGDGEEQMLVLRRAAARFREIVAPVTEPYALADRDDVWTRVRSTPGADYVFAINDRRTYGDYVGAWRLVCEKGLPNRATVTVRRPAGAVYDLVRHEKVAFTVRNGRTEIPVSYETNDGRLLLVADRPLAPLAATSRAVKGGTEIAVTSPDADVMIPIEVTSPALKRPFYGVVKNGTWRHVFPGEGTLPSVRVRNLADGRSFLTSCGRFGSATGETPVAPGGMPGTTDVPVRCAALSGTTDVPVR